MIMDVSRLINEVYKRNGIWDHRTSCHYIRDAVTILWCEIAETLGAPVDAVKAKWRNLRDTYTAECRKMYKRSLNNEPMIRSKWVWFQSMDFLRPHLKNLREPVDVKPNPIIIEDELPVRDLDDTFHFLISLREPLKSLTLDRQMFVRYKIQELLFNETYDHQKQLQSQQPEQVESTPEILSYHSIKIEPPN